MLWRRSVRQTARASPRVTPVRAHRLLRWFPHPRRTTTRSGRCGSITSLWETLLERARDPDFVVSEWLRVGCPTGIGESIIEANGFFPTNVRTVFGHSCST